MYALAVNYNSTRKLKRYYNRIKNVNFFTETYNFVFSHSMLRMRNIIL